MEERSIGSYRLLGELGRGGMGVVWEAWDERLGRRVAIKEIRSGGNEDRRRQRLRREAGTVAQFSHPAIVQVFDILEHDGGVWIVMEYVPGRSLAERLRSGPLTIEETLTLARDIAEGLAEAHDHGFLHRDLKTENVRVTPGGRAKILDFGLAKSLLGSPDEPKLTSTGEVVGTWRAMSPEVALDIELDARSDLFSFGILLYEMVTGRSPFSANTLAHTLARVATYQQRPADEINPSVPPELVRLIDELLAKEREHRPPSARTVAVRLRDIRSSSGSGRVTLESDVLDQPTLDGDSWPETVAVGRRRPRWSKGWIAGAVAVIVGLTAVALIVDDKTRWREPRVVAVAQVSVGDDTRAEVALAAAAVRAAVLRGLLGFAGLVPATENDPSGIDPSGIREPLELAQRLAADKVLTPRLDCEATVCRLTLEQHEANGRLAGLESTEVPLTDLPLAATATHSLLRRLLPQQRWSADIAELQVLPDDYARYLRIERAFRHRARELSREEGVTELEAIQVSSPAFLEAYLLEITLLTDLHFDSRTANEFESALASLAQARRLAPGDPRVANAAFQLALAQGQLDQATAALTDLERQAPGDHRTLARQAHLSERQGDPSRALEQMRRAAHQRPSWQNLLLLANLEIRQGEATAARRTLENMQDRFPKDLESVALLAQLELLSGDPGRAAELYETLVARTPRFADLTNLGTVELLLGEYDAAARHLRRALELVPTNPGAMLNLADAELLNGRTEEAQRLYQEVIRLIEADPAAENSWQWQSVRAQAHAHLGESRQAVAATRRAEHLAPQNPQAAFEAALVYAVVGDETSALLAAEQAIAGGVANHWFDFPWFDTLRATPAFTDLPARGRAVDRDD